jgi:hypothetical protein
VLNLESTRHDSSIYSVTPDATCEEDETIFYVVINHEKSVSATDDEESTMIN